jgi:NAD(P)-dependent dehydrogenase (short-subunit alcohol dehydrogenase family)
MTEEQMGAMTEEFASHISLRRMGIPDDIATVAVFLASSASGYMTGETVIVDGGRCSAEASTVASLAEASKPFRSPVSVGMDPL